MSAKNSHHLDQSAQQKKKQKTNYNEYKTQTENNKETKQIKLTGTTNRDETMTQQHKKELENKEKSGGSQTQRQQKKHSDYESSSTSELAEDDYGSTNSYKDPDKKGSTTISATTEHLRHFPRTSHDRKSDVPAEPTGNDQRHLSANPKRYNEKSEPRDGCIGSTNQTNKDDEFSTIRPTESKQL
jgi:hypothetical protein